MNKEEREIKKILKEAQDYFGKDEKIKMKNKGESLCSKS